MHTQATHWQLGMLEDVRLASASVMASLTSPLSVCSNFTRGGRPSVNEHINTHKAWRVSGAEQEYSLLKV